MTDDAVIQAIRFYLTSFVCQIPPTFNDSNFGRMYYLFMKLITLYTRQYNIYNQIVVVMTDVWWGCWSYHIMNIPMATRERQQRSLYIMYICRIYIWRVTLHVGKYVRVCVRA